jgi:hypothetical protein
MTGDWRCDASGESKSLSEDRVAGEMRSKQRPLGLMLGYIFNSVM